MDEKYVQMIIENKDSCKSAHHRIDGLEIKVEDIHELATSVKLLASETKAMREDVNDMNNRLKIVEDKPLREYEDTRKQIKNNVIAFVCGIILTILAMRFRINKIFVKGGKCIMIKDLSYDLIHREEMNLL